MSFLVVRRPGWLKLEALRNAPRLNSFGWVGFSVSVNNLLRRVLGFFGSRNVQKYTLGTFLVHDLTKIFKKNVLVVVVPLLEEVGLICCNLLEPWLLLPLLN